MAVIFFDGFTRPLDLAYWTNTGGNISLPAINVNAAAGGSVSFTNSNPVVNNLRLSNIGTHTNKKLYFGIRLQQFYVQHDQPFLKFYDASNNVVLTLQWNIADVVSPDIGIEAVLSGGSTLSPFVVDNDIAPVIWSASATDPGLFLNTSVLEFELDLTAYTLAIKFSDQSLRTLSNVTTLSGLTSAINTIAGLAFFGSTTGGTIFDIYLIDNTGSFANTWLGTNFRVHSQTFGGQPQVNTGWVNSANSAPSHTEIDTNDSDASFIRVGEINKEIAWALNDIAVSGLNPAVAGIRMSSFSRRLQLASAYKYFYHDGANFSAGAEMGTRMSLSSDNYAQQALQFINTNPLTSAQWTVADINTHGAFGVKSVDPADPG